MGILSVLSIAVAFALGVLFPMSAVLAQSEDPARELQEVLVGQWSSNLTGTSSPESLNSGLTLVITSVRFDSGVWYAKALYGAPHQGLGPVEIEVEFWHNVTLRFTTSTNSRVTLKLMGVDNLLGTVMPPNGAEGKAIWLFKGRL